ncbi:MAG: AAA family ATPase, partial [Leptospirales bacterium]
IANGGGCWFGQNCLSGPVIVLGGEKSSRAVWRRDFERLGKVTRPGSFLIPELDGPLWKWDRREGVWIKTPSYKEAVRGIKRIKPVLVIGDTIMRLGLGIDQIDNAQQAALGLELEELAVEAGCLFLTIGHTNQASTKEALSWRLHYLSRAGGNGLPGVLRYCFAVTRIHRADVQKNGELEEMFSPEEVSFRKLIACGVSKGNEIPTAVWTNNNPAFFEIMPSGEIMMLDRDRFVSDKPMVVDRAGCLKYPEHEGVYHDPLADL